MQQSLWSLSTKLCAWFCLQWSQSLLQVGSDCSPKLHTFYICRGAMSLEKLTRLRALFASASPKGLAAYIIPSSDAHQSEYVAQCDERRAFISGFDGSAGTAVVTPTRALLWTDGRYFLQASKQLSADWTLMKAGLKDTPTIEVGRSRCCDSRWI